MKHRRGVALPFHRRRCLGGGHTPCLFEDCNGALSFCSTGLVLQGTFGVPPSSLHVNVVFTEKVRGHSGLRRVGGGPTKRSHDGSGCCRCHCAGGGAGERCVGLPPLLLLLSLFGIFACLKFFAAFGLELCFFCFATEGLLLVFLFCFSRGHGECEMWWWRWVVGWGGLDCGGRRKSPKMTKMRRGGTRMQGMQCKRRCYTG